MKRLHTLLAAVILCSILSISVFAAATPSNAEISSKGSGSSGSERGSSAAYPSSSGPALPDSEDLGRLFLKPDAADEQSWEEFQEEEEEEIEEEEAGGSFEEAVLSSLSQILESLNGGDSLASPSEADYLEDPEDSPVFGETVVFDSPVLLSLVDQENFVNVLRYDVTVRGSDYTLLFAPAYADQIYIDSQDRLWNMGTSQIQGMVVDGSFNPYQDSGTLVYLAPCLGNNFSANHNYGSPNWFREYYWNGSGRLTYDDTYVQIQVKKAYHTFFSSDLLTYVLIFLVGGGVLICWLNRFRRY